MSVRVKAFYPVKGVVNVTLRKPVVDLTDIKLSVPAYTHVSGKTVSGRLKWDSYADEYVFEAN